MTGSIAVPEATRRRVSRYFGDAGEAWLESLPSTVEACARRWSLRLGPVFDTGVGQASWTAPVTRADGTKAVLKVSVPHPEASAQADALRACNGRGAVHLFEVSDDGFAMVLERCEPGTSLLAAPWDVAEDAVVGLLPELWAAPAGGPFARLGDVARGWADRIPEHARLSAYDAGVADLAAAIAREFAGTADDGVLLHADLSAGNVLAAQRQPWLAIDPLPMVGERAFDLAQLIVHRAWSLRGAAARERTLGALIESLAARLGLHSRRVAGWALVKAHAWTQGADTALLIARAGRL